MTTTAPSDALQALLHKLEKLGEAPASPIDPSEDPVEELVWSLLLWETTPAKAERAFKRIKSSVVDYNELRVCMPDEISSILGDRYPMGDERTFRIIMALNDIYNREHAVTLEPLRKAPKRESRKYLDAIPGLPQFVAARVSLISLGGHAVPVDEQLLQKLIEEKAVEPDTDQKKAVSVLERAIKAGDAVNAHAALLAWVTDTIPAAGARKPRAKGEKKTTRKRPAKSG